MNKWGQKMENFFPTVGLQINRRNGGFSYHLATTTAITVSVRTIWWMLKSCVKE